MYIKGTVVVSFSAVDRLEELGVALCLSPYETYDGCHGYNSFDIPDEYAEEFDYVSGNPRTSGELRLRSEV